MKKLICYFGIGMFLSGVSCDVKALNTSDVSLVERAKQMESICKRIDAVQMEVSAQCERLEASTRLLPQDMEEIHRLKKEIEHICNENLQAVISEMSHSKEAFMSISLKLLQYIAKNNASMERLKNNNKDKKYTKQIQSRKKAVHNKRQLMNLGARQMCKQFCLQREQYKNTLDEYVKTWGNTVLQLENCVRQMHECTDRYIGN